jgi:drug/metabolite transporter (DMT)-like permease
VLITTLFNVVVLTGIVAILAFTESLPAWNTTGVLWFIAAGIMTTLLARNTLFAGIRRIGPSRAASIRNTRPIVSVTIALLFLGERLSSLAIVGTGMTFLGLFLLIYEAFKHRNTDLKRHTTEEGATKIALEPETLAEGRLAPSSSATPLAASTAMTGTLLAIFSAIFSGSGQAIRKVGLEYLPNAYLGAMIGSCTALLSYIAISAAQGNLRAVFQTSFEAFRPHFWLAGLASTVGQLSFFVAITFAPVSHVVVIAASETILTLILTAILLRQSEIITRWITGAAVAIFAGAILLSLS